MVPTSSVFFLGSVADNGNKNNFLFSTWLISDTNISIEKAFVTRFWRKSVQDGRVVNNDKLLIVVVTYFDGRRGLQQIMPCGMIATYYVVEIVSKNSVIEHFSCSLLLACVHHPSPHAMTDGRRCVASVFVRHLL
jgi:hypothetical protein